jgi:hypothetical protein
MLFPTHSLFSTSQTSLAADYARTAEALRDAINCLTYMSPNGRDYADIEQAQKEHKDRILKIIEVLEQIKQLQLHVSR